MKNFIRILILMVIIGGLHFLFESLLEGHWTHWAMFLIGSIVAFLIGNVNGKISWKAPILQQATIGMGIGVFSEAVAGIILNIILGLGLWNYEATSFFWGQCNLSCCVFWLIAGSLCMFLDDIIRWKLLGEEKPHYKWR